MPIFQSANFAYRGEDSYEALQYIRLNNTPNHRALHAKVAAVEGSPAAVSMASGMGAISTALLTVLGSGDHLLAQDCLYGGTYSLLTDDLSALGIEVTFVSGQHPDRWQAALRPNTRGFYVESMTNPLLEVADLEAVVAFCREHQLVSLIDSTFTSPINYRPVEAGFTLSVQSATKYLNGHSDIVAGTVAGSQEWVKRVTHRLNHLGASLDPHAAFLMHRGLKTLKLRVEAQNRGAQQLAEFLHGHPAVAVVNYAGLAYHPQHQRAARLFRGFGGVLSFEHREGLVGSLRVLDRLQLPLNAPSLGGVETLVTRPATTSHSGMSAEQRSAAGVTDSLIRVAVGIEDPEDLIADFAQALAG